MEMSLLMFLLIPLAVLVLGALLTALAFGASYLLFKRLGKMSGIDKLTERYPAAQSPPQGEIHKKQWLGVGPVFFKNTTDICITPNGLYFWVRSFLSKYPPAIIPWGEFKEQSGALLAGRVAVRLVVGHPQVGTIVVTQRLFEKMKPYLNLPGS